MLFCFFFHIVAFTGHAYRRTDGRTDGQDMQCGLLGRPHNNVLNDYCKLYELLFLRVVRPCSECMEYRPISAKGHVKPDVFDDIVGYDVSSDVTVTRPRGISSSSSSSSSSSCVVPPSPTKSK